MTDGADGTRTPAAELETANVGVENVPTPPVLSDIPVMGGQQVVAAVCLAEFFFQQALASEP